MRRFLFALTAFAAACPVFAVEPIQPKDVDALHALIRPQKDEEKWQQIPWLANLWDARRKAAEEGKPILLWEMDGHPLGCV